ncbi:hypothetical protein M514_26615 [Trichuris suis]|uniref:Uncharacterized protein n=1 Tax=Trichuris suis TaxID=68888 RepID=A0A085MVD6_9BILA|nr:hypothetical protein M514_26615 [Trichuris suis]
MSCTAFKLKANQTINLRCFSRVSNRTPQTHHYSFIALPVPSNSWTVVPISHLHSFPQVISCFGDTCSRNFVALRRNPLAGVQSVAVTCSFHCYVNPTSSRNRAATIALMWPNLLLTGRSA